VVWLTGYKSAILLYRNPHPDTFSFLNFLLNVGEGPPTVSCVGLFELRFPPWLKLLATQLEYNLIFLNKFLLGYTKYAYNQRGCSKRYLHNSQLAKANADNEAIHNAFRDGWLDEVMGGVKINFLDVLDK